MPILADVGSILYEPFASDVMIHERKLNKKYTKWETSHQKQDTNSLSGRKASMAPTTRMLDRIETFDAEPKPNGHEPDKESTRVLSSVDPRRSHAIVPALNFVSAVPMRWNSRKGKL